MSEENGLFQVFKDLWQIVKKYPENVPLTDKNARDFCDMLANFSEKYKDTPYYSLAVSLALAYGDWKDNG